jgi:hypothetical protein
VRDFWSSYEGRGSSPLPDKYVLEKFRFLFYLIFLGYGYIVTLYGHFRKVRMAEWSKAPDLRLSLAPLLGVSERLLVLL